MGLEVEANVGIAIGEHMETAVHAGMKKARHEKPKPLYNVRLAAAIGDGTHNVVLDLGSPQTGRIWQVTRLCLYGGDDHTVVAGVVGGLYVAGNPQANPSLASLRLGSLAFPSNTGISDDELWVHANENVFVVSSVPGAAAQQYGANMVILDWRDADISERSGH